MLYYGVCAIVLAPFLGEVAFHPSRVPVGARATFGRAIAGFGAELEDVGIAAVDGAQLKAWFAVPRQGNGNAVILLHGVGDNREGMTGFAELFLSRGYSVLLPDSRAQGESGGAFPTYGVKERDDVRQWVDWLVLRQHPGCVYAMGESMGAAIVLQAIQQERRFCAVVAESAFASFREIAYIRVGQIFHTGTWLGRTALRPSVELAFLYARVTRGISLTDASPRMAVRNTSTPVLLIHGLADRNIPARQSEIIRSENPARVTLWEVPKADHCGAVAVAPEEFNRRVLGWLADHSRPVPAT